MEPAYLAVARVLKPHGLKGEGLVVALTDDPETVFVQGRQLTPLNEEGVPAGAPAVVFRARHYHRRQWLLAFEGIQTREPIDVLRDQLLGAVRTDLRPLREGEMYEHEIPGCAVVVDGKVVGVARGLVEVPQGKLLIVDRPVTGAGEGETRDGAAEEEKAEPKHGKELLVPFRPPILLGLNRAERRIEIAPPPGLLDL